MTEDGEHGEIVDAELVEEKRDADEGEAGVRLGQELREVAADAEHLRERLRAVKVSLDTGVRPVELGQAITHLSRIRAAVKAITELDVPDIRL